MSIKTAAAKRPVLTPAILTTLAAAILSLLVSFGIPLTPEQQDNINSVITISAPIVLAAVVSRRVVGKHEAVNRKDVVEHAQDGHVLAGEASELPTNTHVRELGELDESV